MAFLLALLELAASSTDLSSEGLATSVQTHNEPNHRHSHCLTSTGSFSHWESPTNLPGLFSVYLGGGQSGGESASPSSI